MMGSSLYSMQELPSHKAVLAMEFDPRHEPACWFSVRHGVLNAEMVHGLYYEHLTLESLEREFRTLRRGGLLSRFVDTEGRVYYLPTERLCTPLGAHRSTARGRGARTVARAPRAGWRPLGRPSAAAPGATGGDSDGPRARRRRGAAAGRPPAADGSGRTEPAGGHRRPQLRGRVERGAAGGSAAGRQGG